MKHRFYLMWTIAIVVLALVGCLDVEQSQCKGEQSYTEIQIDQNGLTLLPTDSMYITFGQTTQAYEEVMACMGMTAPGPTVEFTSFCEIFGGDPIGGGGAYYHIYELIHVNNDESDYFLRDCESDMKFLKHEMIHHILWMNGYGEEISAHDPDYFIWECITK
jgi:hypothetical protein